MADKIIAKVAGHDVSESEFAEFVSRIPQQQQQYVQTPEGRHQALAQYCNYFLFEKLGTEKGYDESEEYLKILEGTKRELLSQYTLTQLVKDITATPDECRAYYEKNKDQFKTGPKAKASHILTDTEEESLSILDKIKDGRISFEDAARESSTCPSGAKGGDLGTFGRGQMVQEFDEAVFNDPAIGEIMGPVKTQFGYHLIRVDSLTEAGTAPFDQLVQHIAQKVIEEKQNKAYMDIRADLISKYGLEYL